MGKIVSLLCSIILVLSLMPLGAFANTKDTTAPVIEGFELVTATVKPKEKIQVKVKATDDLSGVNSIYVEFKSPTGTHSVSGGVSIAKATENNTYIITTDAVNPYAEGGTWYLAYVSVSDVSRNHKSESYGYDYSYEKIPSVTVEVQNETVDTTAPVIEGFELVTATVKPKEKIQVKVKATDDLSGVNSIYVEFKSPTGTHSVSGGVSIAKATENNTYIITTDAVNPYAEGGTWYLAYVSVSDVSRNHKSESYGYDYSYEKTPSVTVNVGQTGEVKPVEPVDPKPIDPVIPTPVDPKPIDPVIPTPVEPIPTEDNFKIWEAKYNVEKNKKWTIKFALPFDPTTIYDEDNIYVVSNDGTMMSTSFIIDNTSATGTALDASAVTILAPRGGYTAGETYTLYIRNVKGKNGELLNQFVKMDFTIKSENNQVTEIE